MSDTESRWNTPLIQAKTANYAVHAGTSINAPAALVFRTIRNTETWKDWNAFIPRVTIKSQPQEDDATDAEFADLVLLETSRALSLDSDIASSLPPNSRSRRLSETSDSNKLSAAQQYQEFNQGRRGSYASQKSNKETRIDKSPMVPTTEEDANGANQDPSTQESPFTSNAPPSRRGSLAPSSSTIGRASGSAKRRLSMNSIYGELPIRLIVGTQLTLHIRNKLPTSPSVFKQLSIVVTEVSRPPDPLNPDESLTSPTTGTATLTQTKTHTGDKGSGIYRIVWGNETSGKPKFLLQFQRVWEIRPQYSADGKEEWSDVVMWECAKGMTVKSTMGEKPYLQKMFVVTMAGLKQFCESLGGKGVERRDFSVA